MTPRPPAPPERTVHRFRGYIAGAGTTSGTRIVVGHWPESPLGSFTDVMVQDADGRRLLLAPSHEVAAYVGQTYVFDEVLVVAVRLDLAPGQLTVHAGPLRAALKIGGRPPLGQLLRSVPPRIGTSPRWLSAIDPLARLMAGARTAGSAGGGRKEYYGVTDLRRVTALHATWDGEDLGPLTRIEPPVTFGFGSVPASPSIATVVTTIRFPLMPG